MKLKSYQLLILILIGSLLVAAVVGGVAKVGLDAVVTRCPSIARHVNYKAEEQTYDFGRPFRHLAMGISLVALIFFVRRLEILSQVKAALQLRPGWWRQLAAGIAIGLFSVSLIIAVSAFYEVRTFRAQLRLSHLLGDLAKLAPMVAGLSILEELLFRGFVLQSFLKDMRAPIAIVVTSLIFSSLHFLDVRVVLPVGTDLLAGLRGLAIFTGLFHDPLGMLPKLLGICFFGILLSCAYVWTRSLYLPIGIHAGGVFTLKASRLLFARERLVLEWFFGDGLVITGLLGVIFLFLVTLLLYFVWGRSIRNSQSATGN